MAIELMGIDHASGPDETAWTMHIGRNTAVIELGALLAGLGFPVTAHFTDSGDVLIRPKNVGTPPPTAQQVRDIYEHGISLLPSICLRPMPRAGC